MAELLAQSVRQLEAGVAQLADARAATPASRPTPRSRPSAISRRPTARRWARWRTSTTCALVMGRQELYRRCSRMGEAAVDVAERLIYAGLKES